MDTSDKSTCSPENKINTEVDASPVSCNVHLLNCMTVIAIADVSTAHNCSLTVVNGLLQLFDFSVVGGLSKDTQGGGTLRIQPDEHLLCGGGRGREIQSTDKP